MNEHVDGKRHLVDRGRARTLALRRILAASLGLTILPDLALALPTTVGGDAYITQCEQNGVPIPPAFNYEDAWHEVDPDGWLNAGVLEPEYTFAGDPNKLTDVFYYVPPDNDGLCIALPRSFKSADPTIPENIDLLGVICQGSTSGKACFWDVFAADRGAFGRFDVIELSDLAGGTEIDTDECTSCHRGQNAFLIHGYASASLNQDLPNRFAASWYDPIVPATWSGSDNAGPADYFGGPEYQGDQCLSCHGNPFGGGNFPQITATTTSYCDTLLGEAAPVTMGADEENDLHRAYAAMRALCSGEEIPDFSPLMKMMNMEAAGLNKWTTDRGTLSTNTQRFVEGVASMSVNSSGYTRLNSAPFQTWELQSIGSLLQVDVYVPPQGQPQPSWLGSVQFYMTIPSAQINNAWIGQGELTPKGTGWQTVSVGMPSAVVNALKQQYPDARFGIAVNTAQGAPPVLLDKMRFAGTLVPGPIGPQPGETKYDFERSDEWSNWEGAIVDTSTSADVTYRGDKSMKLSFNGSSSGRVWLTPYKSPPPGSTVKVKVYVPSNAPVTAISPFVMDANWQWTDTWNANLPRGGWVTLSVVVPANAAAPLKQLGVKVYLSRPYTGPIYVDAVSW